MPKVNGFKTTDVRFPTSRGLDGSDAMNQDPDYSAAYLELKTDDPNLSGYALFKGWLLLSQPTGCFGVFTSFHT